MIGNKFIRFKKISNALFVVTFISFFSPFDFCFRHNLGFGVGIRPVVEIHDSYQIVREFEANGLKRDSDFIVYHNISKWNSVKWVLVVFIP